MPFNAKFLFPVFLPFVWGVLPEHNQFGQIGNDFIRPTPGDSLEATAKFSEYSFQSRYNCGDNARLNDLMFKVDFPAGISAYLQTTQKGRIPCSTIAALCHS